MSENERVARFEASVNKHIKLLSAPDAATRRQAAAWLGEAGDPKAITRLKQVYEDDDDAGVRAAAGYSLSMFRALEQALADDKRQAKALKLFEDIVHKNKMGRRTRVPRGCLRQLAAALVTSLLVLLAFNFVVWPLLLDPSAPTPAAPAPLTPAPAAADETQPAAIPPTAAPTPDPAVTQHLNALNAIVNDVRGPRGAASTLAQYWNDVRSSGGTGGCTQPLPPIPADYSLPAEVAAAAPDLELAAGLVNTGLGLLRLGWAEFQAACAASPAASLNAGLEKVSQINSAFSTASEQLDELRGG